MIEGMTCEHCRARVESRLNELDGVSAKVNLKKKIAVVSMEKDIAARNSQKFPEHPQNEQEAIADIYRRMDEIQENLAYERRQRKKLAEQIPSKESI
ncbi:MAG: cation transporter [bacterium]|nr:cation transporter [bacterium]